MWVRYSCGGSSRSCRATPQAYPSDGSSSPAASSSCVASSRGSSPDRSSVSIISKVPLVGVPGVLQGAEIRAEQTRECLDATLPLRLQAGVLPERRPVAPPVAVQQEMDQRPGRAVGENGPIGAPERIAGPGDEQGAQGDRPLVLHLLQILEERHARVELQPHLSGDDRPGPADLA